MMKRKKEHERACKMMKEDEIGWKGWIGVKMDKRGWHRMKKDERR